MAAFVGLVSELPGAHERFAARTSAIRAAYRGSFQTWASGALSLASEGLGVRPLPPGEGLLLGEAFERGAAGATERPALTEERVQRACGGEGLVEQAWGPYVAVLPGRDGRVDVVRAPLGALPCYLLASDDGVLFGSSAALLFRYAQRRPAVDPEALVRQLAYANLRRRETCLAGLTELAGGEQARISSRTVAYRTLWSPWTWAARRRAFDRADDASRALADRAADCVASLAPGPVLLKLSGGLDSSIVAACLARAERPFEALTLVTDDPAGDERGYARAVARHFGARLHEVRRDPALFDPARSPAWRLPRPSMPGFRQVSDRITAETASAIGASAVFDGSGGDNVFCSLQSALPVVDCLRARAGRRHALETISSIAAIAQVSAFAVLRRATRRLLRPRRDYRWPADLDLLAAEAIDAAGATLAHPWLRAPPSVLPGKAAHVALLAAAQSYVEGIDPELDPPHIAPLVAQPLVELCLQIPSWRWFGDGQNRFAARQAFRAMLPRHVVARRTKGSPDSFVAQLFEQRRAVVRAQLLDGMLAGDGLIDRARIAALTDGRPLSDRHLHRVMALFDAEVWAGGWSGWS